MAGRNQSKRSEREIFAAWMSEHSGIIAKIVRGFTNNPADAEDLTQEIGLALWRSIPSFRGDSKASTWIWRIALNQAISSKRSSREAPVALDEVIEPRVSDRSDDFISVDLIYDAIRTLAPIDRSLIMLSLEGATYAEIADITGLTETNVGARLSRSRSRLTQQMEQTR